MLFDDVSFIITAPYSRRLSDLGDPPRDKYRSSFTFDGPSNKTCTIAHLSALALNDDEVWRLRVSFIRYRETDRPNDN